MPSSRFILIVNDDLTQANLLKEELSTIGYNIVGIAANVDEADQYKHHLQLNLIISELFFQEKEDGLRLVENMRDVPLPVILLADTANDEVFGRVATVQPSAFLVRPYNLFSLRSAIEFSRITLESTEYNNPVFVKSNNLLIQVKPEDIMYVHAEGNYCHMVMRHRKLLLKMSMNQVQAMLNPEDFIQVHRNYIVRLTEIESISLTNNELMINGEIIPISKMKFRDDLLRRVKMVK